MTFNLAARQKPKDISPNRITACSSPSSHNFQLDPLTAARSAGSQPATSLLQFTPPNSGDNLSCLCGVQTPLFIYVFIYLLTYLGSGTLHLWSRNSVDINDICAITRTIARFKLCYRSVDVIPPCSVGPDELQTVELRASAASLLALICPIKQQTSSGRNRVIPNVFLQGRCIRPVTDITKTLMRDTSWRECDPPPNLDSPLILINGVLVFFFLVDIVLRFSPHARMLVWMIYSVLH